MSKRPRPYIPISIRLQVAQRQLVVGHSFVVAYSYLLMDCTKKIRLDRILAFMFHAPQLDHDPALILRKLNPRTGKYTPDANDPNYLIYREKADHQKKTSGRNPGASRTITTKGSDVWLAKKFRRLEKSKNVASGGEAGIGSAGHGSVGLGEAWRGKARHGKARSRKIPSRGFSKQKRPLK
jgi:hypothetical protein